MKKFLPAVLILSLCIFLAGNAQADTKSANLAIFADAQVTCILQGNSIDFGTYDGDFLQGNTTITVQCTDQTAYTISYNEGNSFDGSRRMESTEVPENYLGYYLECQDIITNSVNQECGDDALIGFTSSGTGNGNLQTWEIEGYVYGGQFVPAGIYEDNVAITLTF